MSIVKGPTVVQQGTSHTWTPTGGFVYLPKYEGMASDIEAIAAQWRLAGRAYSLRRDGPTAVIEAQQNSPTDGSLEIPSDAWDLNGDDETVDIRDHPKYKALHPDFKTTFKLMIDQEVEMPKPTDQSGAPIEVVVDIGDGLEPYEVHFVPDDPSGAYDFYLLIYNGQTHYTRTNYVLVHRMTVSYKFDNPTIIAANAGLSGQNIGRVYTFDMLLAECATYSDPLPDLLRQEILKIDENADIDLTAIPYTWGWLKRKPRISTVAKEKVECTVEYCLEVWPEILYPSL